METTYTFDKNLFSDFYKDTYGFRPRNHAFYSPETTDSERQKMWDNLIVSHDAEMERYDAQQQYNIIQFENLVEKTMSVGASDRKMAIRWIIQGLDLTEWDLMYGGGYIAYKFDLPYSYEKEFDAIIETI
jgi:hypothetical protein